MLVWILWLWEICKDSRRCRLVLSRAVVDLPGYPQGLKGLVPNCPGGHCERTVGGQMTPSLSLFRAYRSLSSVRLHKNKCQGMHKSQSMHKSKKQVMHCIGSRGLLCLRDTSGGFLYSFCKVSSSKLISGSRLKICISIYDINPTVSWSIYSLQLQLHGSWMQIVVAFQHFLSVVGIILHK